jgi:hypothetical protein
MKPYLVTLQNTLNLWLLQPAVRARSSDRRYACRTSSLPETTTPIATSLPSTGTAPLPLWSSIHHATYSLL